MDAVTRLENAAFGRDLRPERIELEHTVMEFDRTVGAWDHAELVGMTSAYTLTMTVPGGPRQVAGVSWVGVLPTHRRRGILTSLMRHQLASLHEEQREPVAALWSSEPPIYGRFGYGPATRHLELTIGRGPSALHPEPSDGTLRLRLVRPEESIPLVEPVYAAEVARRPGLMAREREGWQRRAIFDPESERGGASSLQVVLAEDGNGVRAYARYSTVAGWDGGGPNGEVQVQEVFALDSAAEATVWRFLADMDLMTRVSVPNRPVDDPLIELLTDPSRADATLRAGLFVRLVDVDRALAARTYATPINIVLAVVDPVCPWNAGSWRLSGDESGAACEPTTAPADLTLSAVDLGAAYLGGTSLRSLADAGRVQEHRAGAVRAATFAFRSELAPWCSFVF
jgi:predicted acetyltransferase